MHTVLVLASLLPTVAMAQADQTGRSPLEEYQRGYAATPMPGQGAIDSVGAAAVDRLNNQAAQASTQAVANDATVQGANQAQYEADRAAYMEALARHDRVADRTDARYRRQQNAYADAMSVWRVQVAECQRGHRAACDLPAPDPADYY